MIGVECVSAFAADSILQLHMMQAGVLWHLLLFLFYYDFTLDEGGVEKSESSNQQVRRGGGGGMTTEGKPARGGI